MGYFYLLTFLLTLTSMHYSLKALASVLGCLVPVIMKIATSSAK